MVQKVTKGCEFEPGLGHQMTGKLGQPSRVPFSNQRRIRQQKERDGLHLSIAMPKIQYDSNPHCP